MNDNPQILRFDSIESTNLMLKQLNDDNALPEFSVVITDHQTAGRGQPGNKWESEKGKNLTFSFIIRPDFLDVREQFRITQVVTVAMMDLLSTVAEGFSIKWPNDIYAGDKKVAGILIENSLIGNHINSSIIGIGLNLNQEEFTSKAPNPVSLKQITGVSYDINQMMNDYMNCFINRYAQWLEEGDAVLTDDYFGQLYRSRGTYRFKDATGEFMASIHTIEPDGHLLLATETNEIRRYAFKEVSFIL
ncbi:biotin--[acetyl-CoA-carboxylase] ligase [Alkaliflexus imshenetskii]|uniref:biotin--[acetyl-CoA-carboxylase] ligase n=1 Tax=Alkaliflexus imshenetskii TaxID=286730 RepID=UPI00047DDE25|nr:biotin--[acetyl-CoA-carboxylase] ligase [Alkaliflexus imshenetskii]